MKRKLYSTKHGIVMSWTLTKTLENKLVTWGFEPRHSLDVLNAKCTIIWQASETLAGLNNENRRYMLYVYSMRDLALVLQAVYYVMWVELESQLFLKQLVTTGYGHWVELESQLFLKQLVTTGYGHWVELESQLFLKQLVTTGYGHWVELESQLFLKQLVTSVPSTQYKSVSPVQKCVPSTKGCPQ